MRSNKKAIKRRLATAPPSAKKTKKNMLKASNYTDLFVFGRRVNL